MYTANDIKNVRFAKSMNGYKQEDVDIFLDSVEADYTQFDAKVAELEAQVAALSKQVDDLNISQSSIQNVLVSAQKLADQIVNEAKTKAEEIIVEAKVRANDINRSTEEKAAEDMAIAERNKREAEAEYVAIMQRTAEKSEAMISAAHDSVARQQLLFDKLKLDIINFKSHIMAIYKEHLDSLSKLPEEVPFDAVRAAEAAAFAFENVPDYTQVAAAPAEEAVEEVADAEVEDAPAVEETAVEIETIAEPKAEENAEIEETIIEPDVPLGFKVNLESEEDPEEEEEDKPAKGFFKRKR